MIKQSDKSLKDIQIIVKLEGGLGNQMFQYAFGKAVEHKTGLKVAFDNSYYLKKNQLRKLELERYNTNLTLVNDIYRKNVFKKVLKEILIFKNIKNRINPYSTKLRGGFMRVAEKNSIKYDENLIINDCKNKIFYDGFFQTEKYFLDIKDIIKNNFTLKENLDEENLKILNEIKNSESISVHIRRGDYLNIPGFSGICSVEYYKKAMSVIKEKMQGKDLKAFIFSEDTEWVKENIKFDIETIYVSNNKADKGYLDLELMKNCKHNIIANSTFSWWGAWLNNNPDKIVIAPEPWFVGSNNTDIVSDNWIRLNGFLNN